MKSVAVNSEAQAQGQAEGEGFCQAWISVQLTQHSPWWTFTKRGHPELFSLHPQIWEFSVVHLPFWVYANSHEFLARGPPRGHHHSSEMDPSLGTLRKGTLRIWGFDWWWNLVSPFPVLNVPLILPSLQSREIKSGNGRRRASPSSTINFWCLPQSSNESAQTSSNGRPFPPSNLDFFLFLNREEA